MEDVFKRCPHFGHHLALDPLIGSGRNVAAVKTTSAKQNKPHGFSLENNICSFATK